VFWEEDAFEAVCCTFLYESLVAFRGVCPFDDCSPLNEFSISRTTKSNNVFVNVLERRDGEGTYVLWVLVWGVVVLPDTSNEALDSSEEGALFVLA
jgi:hypothetical protein